jgi:hypothetical protein
MVAYQQLTIRELMAIVLFAATGLAALSRGGLFASIVIGAAIIITTAFAIVAFVARAEFRSFALGFLIPVVTYSAAVLSIGKSELDPYEGMLPTTKLLKPCFELLVNREYVNLMTNQPVPDYDPTANTGLGGGGMGGSPVGMRETPDRPTFMSLAHVLLAVMFGYIGAKFAVWVDRKQLRRTGDGDEQSGEREPPITRVLKS